MAFKLLLCGVNNSYDVQVKEVKDAPSSDESSKKMHVQFCKFDVKYLGAYIVGLRITCSYSNNGIEVFDGQSSFSWEEKKSVPEKHRVEMISICSQLSVQLILHPPLITSTASDYSTRSLMYQVWNTQITFQLGEANPIFPSPFFPAPSAVS